MLQAGRLQVWFLMRLLGCGMSVHSRHPLALITTVVGVSSVPTSHRVFQLT
jgi:hypothetical protein